MLDYLEGSSPVSGVPADVLRVIVSGILDDQKPRFIQLERIDLRRSLILQLRRNI